MSTPVEDEQNEEAQVKLEERLERGFEKVITKVLVANPHRWRWRPYEW